MKGKQDYRKSYQGQMMKNRLEMIAQIADQLQNQIQPTDQLPNWFVDKIAKTEKRLIESREFVKMSKGIGSSTGNTADCQREQQYRVSSFVSSFFHRLG